MYNKLDVSELRAAAGAAAAGEVDGDTELLSTVLAGYCFTVTETAVTVRQSESLFFF